MALISHASKLMLIILHDSIQQYVKHEIPDVQAGFRKDRETRDQIANILWVIEKARKFQKSIYFCFIDYAKDFAVWITTNCGKFLEMVISGHLTCLLRNLVQVKKQQLKMDMEQQTGSKLGKEYVKVVYCHSAYLTYMQST